MGDSGHEFITAKALETMLGKLKDEIVKDVAAEMTAEITKQITGIIDAKIDAAVKPIQKDLEDQIDRNTRHSKRLTEIAQQIVAQTDQNTKVMNLFAQTGEQISHLTKSVDALIQSNQNMQKMIEFQGREIEQNRKMVDDTNAREQRRNNDTMEFRNSIHQNLNVVTRSVVDIENKIGRLDTRQQTIEKNQAESAEFLKRVNVLASLFDKRRNQAAVGIATVMLTQGDTIVQFISNLLGG